MIGSTLKMFTLAAFIVASLSAIAACQSTPKGQSRSKDEMPGRFASADVAKLKWIEGTWRGTGVTQPEFFERYFLEGDTLVTEGYEDRTLKKITETTRWELRDGIFGNRGEIRWAASKITEDLITFVPVAGARNAFTWKKEANGTWTAILEWPAAADKPARTVVYKMERWDAQ